METTSLRSDAETIDGGPSLSDRIAALETAVARMSAVTDEQNALLKMIKDSVEPAIEGLKNSAIGSMLGIR